MRDLLQQVEQMIPSAIRGSVITTAGMTAEVAGFPVPVGAQVSIERLSGDPLAGEVIGFRSQVTRVAPFGKMDGIRYGASVRLTQTHRRLKVGPRLLGRVLDALGECRDGQPTPCLTSRVQPDQIAPDTVDRRPIRRPLSTGIRAIDTFLTCGLGQRLGVFSGAGVGKSLLLGMLVRQAQADVVVVALIGERGREVTEFLERELDPEVRARSVVVVATSDEPAIRRVQAAQTATAIAEHFRDTGKHVLLVMDSLSRFASAQREIGLANGEPPTTRGYPPSVFAQLPRLVERAGCTRRGAITGCYAVLVEGDNLSEPVSDCVRSLLDGHIVLSRELAARGHYPAIDVLGSVSRLMPQVATPAQRESASALREMLAVLAEYEDLIAIGAYRRGANQRLDSAIRYRDELNEFLRQGLRVCATPREIQEWAARVAEKYRAGCEHPYVPSEADATMGSEM
ncbi:MAG: FliI/YscN family ATPase [Planctomycetota bacterium]|nr:FliI/YscN family ATPase [Planctomycetota bacterium]